MFPVIPEVALVQRKQLYTSFHQSWMEKCLLVCLQLLCLLLFLFDDPYIGWRGYWRRAALRFRLQIPFLCGTTVCFHWVCMKPESFPPLMRAYLRDLSSEMFPWQLLTGHASMSGRECMLAVFSFSFLMTVPYIVFLDTDDEKCELCRHICQPYSGDIISGPLEYRLTPLPTVRVALAGQSSSTG